MSQKYLISYQQSGIVGRLEVPRHIDAPEALGYRCKSMGESAQLLNPHTYKVLAICSRAGVFEWIDGSQSQRRGEIFLSTSA